MNSDIIKFQGKTLSATDLDIDDEIYGAIDRAASASSYAASIERQLWRLLAKNGSVADYRLALHIVKGNYDYIRDNLLSDMDSCIDKALAQIENLYPSK